MNTVVNTDREYLHTRVSFGDRIADKVAANMGSWRFIIIQTAIVIVWMGFNALFYFLAFDRFPFILLNLLFSTQAAYAAPIIMMSQNRQAAIDRQRDDHEAREVDELFLINQQQLQILQQQNQILDAIKTLTEQVAQIQGDAA